MLSLFVFNLLGGRFYFILFLLFLLFRAAPSAYGYSQARLPACAIATAMPDLSCICDLHHSSWQRQILNSLNKARDQTRNLVVPSQNSTFKYALVKTYWPMDTLEYMVVKHKESPSLSPETLFCLMVSPVSPLGG